MFILSTIVPKLFSGNLMLVFDVTGSKLGSSIYPFSAAVSIASPKPKWNLSFINVSISFANTRPLVKMIHIQAAIVVFSKLNCFLLFY